MLISRLPRSGPGHPAPHRAPARCRPAPTVYGCRGSCDDLHDRSLLHDDAVPHDDDALDHARDDGQVVADEQQRHAALRHEPLQQGEHAVLDRHVQRRRRLVRDQQPRAGGQGDRDRDALTLPAGQLVAGRRARCARRAARPRSSAAVTAARSAAPRRPRWRRSGSAIWRPTRISGSSAVSGSWNTIWRDRAAERAQRRIGAADDLVAVEPASIRMP